MILYGLPYLSEKPPPLYVGEYVTYDKAKEFLIKESMETGKMKGIQIGEISMVQKLRSKGYTLGQITEMLDLSESKVSEYLERKIDSIT